MDYLIDTNVLVRAIQRHDPASQTARRTLIELTRAGNRLCVTLQNASEFWVVCTRSRDSNGLGLRPYQAERYFSRFESLFTLLPETPDVYFEWKRLVTSHAVSGAKAHDARLVAMMLAHSVPQIVTFDVSDFKRYSGIAVTHPSDVLRS